MLKKYGYIDLFQPRRIPLHDIPARKRRLRRRIQVVLISVGIVWFVLWFFGTLLNDYVSTTKWTPTWFLFIPSLTKGFPVIKPVTRAEYTFGLESGYSVEYISSASVEEINMAIRKYMESKGFKPDEFSPLGGVRFRGNRGSSIDTVTEIQSDGSVHVTTYEFR